MEFKPQTESLMTSSTGEDSKTDDANYHGNTNDNEQEEEDEPQDLKAAKKRQRVDINKAHQLLKHSGTTLL